MTEINNAYVPRSFVNSDTGQLKVSQATAETVQAGVLAKLGQLPDAAERQAFLAKVADLAPGDVDTPEELSAKLDSFIGARQQVSGASATPTLAFIGDVAELIGKLMIQQAFDQRENALKDRMAAREAAQADLMAQADKMLEAAQKMQTGAIVGVVLGALSAAASVAGSLTSAIGGLKSLKEMNGQMKQLQTATKTLESANDQVSNLSKISQNVGTEADKAKFAGLLKGAEATQSTADTAVKNFGHSFNTANTKGMTFGSIGQVVNSAGDISKSIGGGADNLLQAEAKGKEAEGSKDAAEAQYHQQIADGKKEIEDSMKQMVEQIINFIKELRDAEVDAMRAITRG